ncbi:coiled-coil domain-containing protein 93 isoform X1 [Colletes latitarsis]|uniref:coiled-coil domain-containing protein 93 isoform X1 n=1 Tax=Colletes latitarsis TaxID=2605962 RepID=UPI0040355061
MLDDASIRIWNSSEYVEVDIRKDEEQAKRFHDIIDLLLAAGYFRARIKDLSFFDRVIGGMTWCIESCNFDVDVDLLFQEDLTIGQKISLTEKILAVLPNMNCPYRIEPHQIQGLDYIHIFPIIQWLVKRLMETREETANFVRSFALDQFHKKHSFTEDAGTAKTVKDNLVRNIQLVKKSYEPRRLFKYKDGATRDKSIRFLGTVLEYEAPLYFSSKSVGSPTAATSDAGQNNDRKEELKEKDPPLQENTEQLAENLAAIEESSTRLSMTAVGNIVGIQAQEIAKVAEEYTMSTSEIEESGSINTSALTALQKQKAALQNRTRKLTKERDSLSAKVTELIDKTNESRAKRQTIERSLKKAEEMGITENDSVYKRLEELLLVHDGLKEQEHNFREQCNSDLNRLRGKFQEIKSGTSEEEEDRAKEYVKQVEAVRKARFELAGRSRSIAYWSRLLDDIPGRSEFAQYQKRFMELYNQVSAKHKETKQYFTLYNTLADTKLYLSKELSLLDSIQHIYNRAMASTSGKEQFMRQFEMIVAGVKINKAKVDKRCTDEKNKRDALSQQLATLIEQQRKYVAAVRQLTIECRKNEALLAQLRDSYSRG